MSPGDNRIDDRYRTQEKYTTLRGIRAEARRKMADIDWNYLHCGTGDETTREANTAIFDRYLFDTPLFAGVANPDTRTSVLGMDLAFPAFIGPFGGGAVFHHEGHCAVGRAAETVGIRQMVPAASSFSLETVAAASSVAKVFQMTFVGHEDGVVDMMHRAKAAGYAYICATYSPIRQWRERLMEDRYSPRGGGDGSSNFGEGLSDPANLQELLDFTEPRWTWAEAARAIARLSSVEPEST